MSAQTHLKALRAAAAVTGSANRALRPALPAIAATTLAATQLISCATPSQPDPQPLTSTPTAAQPVHDSGADCSDKATIKERFDCCDAVELQAPGCTLCDPLYDETRRVEHPNCLPYTAAPPAQFLEYCKRALDQHHVDLTEEEIGISCTPWGPPAPPMMGALTLQELLAMEQPA